MNLIHFHLSSVSELIVRHHRLTVFCIRFIRLGVLPLTVDGAPPLFLTNLASETRQITLLCARSCSYIKQFSCTGTIWPRSKNPPICQRVSVNYCLALMFACRMSMSTRRRITTSHRLPRFLNQTIIPYQMKRVALFP